MKKTYSLSVESIETLKKDLLDYKNNIINKLPILVDRLAKAGFPVIDSKMTEARVTYDEKGVKSGANPVHEKYVRVDSDGATATATLVVSGEDLLFIEFGAGVSYNTSVGDSPHPKGKEFGFVIGSYGKGYGSRKAWGYYDESGNLVITRGVKATMPVLEASNEIADRFLGIAREVFKNVDK